MKILVTGGTGFIGQHLLRFLLQKAENQIYALVRQPQKMEPALASALSVLRGDLFNLPSLPPDLDLVFHLAGLTKAARSTAYYKVNHLGTASLLKALENQRKKIRFIYLSSQAAAGPARDSIPVKETDPPSPLNPYGRSKLMGEKAALSYARRFHVIILRIGAVYGPGDRDFLAFFSFIRRGLLPLFDSGRMRFNLCYVTDLVRALDLAARSELPSGEIFNIGDARSYSWEEIGRTAALVLEKKVIKIKIPLPVVFGVAALSHFLSWISGRASVINLDKYKEMKASFWLADMSKARQGLGFQPQYDLKTGLKETLEWYLKEGWL